MFPITPWHRTQSILSEPIHMIESSVAEILLNPRDWEIRAESVLEASQNAFTWDIRKRDSIEEEWLIRRGSLLRYARFVSFLRVRKRPPSVTIPSSVYFNYPLKKMFAILTSSFIPRLPRKRWVKSFSLIEYMYSILGTGELFTWWTSMNLYVIVSSWESYHSLLRVFEIQESLRCSEQRR